MMDQVAILNVDYGYCVFKHTNLGEVLAKEIIMKLRLLIKFLTMTNNLRQ